MTRVQQADFTLEFDRCTLLSGSKHAWAPFHCMSDALDYGLLCLQQMNGSRASARSYCAASDLHSWLRSNYPPEEGWNFRRAEAAAQKLVAHLPAPMRLQISPASSKEAAGELILLDPITALVELVRRWGDKLKLKYTPRTDVAGDRVYSEPHECSLFEKVTMFAREKNGGRTWVCLYACGNLSDTPPFSVDDIDILALSDWSDGAARGNSAFHPWFLSPVAIDRKYRKHVRFLLGFFKEGTHMPNASHVLCACNVACDELTLSL
jgi:hypothetical protein